MILVEASRFVSKSSIPINPVVDGESPMPAQAFWAKLGFMSEFVYISLYHAVVFRDDLRPLAGKDSWCHHPPSDCLYRVYIEHKHTLGLRFFPGL